MWKQGLMYHADYLYEMSNLIFWKKKKKKKMKENQCFVLCQFIIGMSQFITI